MLRILHDTKYDFIKPWRIAIGVTMAFIALGMVFLGVHHGLNRSIEFTGGTLVQAEFAKKPDVGELRSTIDAAGFQGAEIQQFGSDTSYTIRAAGHATRRQQTTPTPASSSSKRTPAWGSWSGIRRASWPLASRRGEE